MLIYRLFQAEDILASAHRGGQMTKRGFSTLRTKGTKDLQIFMKWIWKPTLQNCYIRIMTAIF